MRDVSKSACTKKNQHNRDGTEMPSDDFPATCLSVASRVDSAKRRTVRCNDIAGRNGQLAHGLQPLIAIAGLGPPLRSRTKVRQHFGEPAL